MLTHSCPQKRYDLWKICVETPLGVASSSVGQEITLERTERKESMRCALEPRRGEEATRADDGSVPGDGLGESVEAAPDGTFWSFFGTEENVTLMCGSLMTC